MKLKEGNFSIFYGFTLQDELNEVGFCDKVKSSSIWSI